MSARNVGEYSFNKRIVDQLLDELKKLPGTRVVFINSSGDSMSMEQRVQAIAREKPDIFISIHHDSVQPMYLSEWVWEGKTATYCDRYSGFSIFYSQMGKRYPESLRLASLTGKFLTAEGLRPSLHHAEKIPGENRKIVDAQRGIYRFDELVVLKSAACPAVLIECGIIKNRSEELLLDQPFYQRKIITSVREAISEFLRNSKDRGVVDRLGSEKALLASTVSKTRRARIRRNVLQINNSLAEPNNAFSGRMS